MKNSFFIVLLLAVACNNVTSNDEQQNASNQPDSSAVVSEIISSDIDTAKLIIPGVSIGSVKIDEDAALLEGQLGKPDSSDAAMGKAWLFWFGKKDEQNFATELDIFTSYKDTSMNGKSVKLVRTTSSFFFTEKGIKVSSSLTNVQQQFALKRIGSYMAKDGNSVVLYDDESNGIAFEFNNDSQTCAGIIIHQKNIPVLNTYLTFHPDMKIDSANNQ